MIETDQSFKELVEKIVENDDNHAKWLKHVVYDGEYRCQKNFSF